MPSVDIPNHYMCKVCRVIKPDEDFYKDRSRTRGLSHDCKKCSKELAYKSKQRNKAKYLARQNEITKILKEEVYEIFGNKCACCGESEREFLCIDHINGDGNEERRTNGYWGGQAFYRFIKKEGFPKDKYQILCHNCNRSKGTGPNRVCIHKREHSKLD